MPHPGWADLNLPQDRGKVWPYFSPDRLLTWNMRQIKSELEKFLEGPDKYIDLLKPHSNV